MRANPDPASGSVLPLALMVFCQMLPATLLTPAIRPLFADLHGGSEGAMHAFMSLNMIAAALIAPWLGHRIDRRDSRRRWLAVLCLLDGFLLSACTLPLPTPLVLALRFFEGGAHVGGATLLLSEALCLSRTRRDPAVMGLTGAGIMAAVALGNVLGAGLVGFSPRAPFYAASACAWFVAAAGPRFLHLDVAKKAAARVALREVFARLALPLSAVFVARFTVGCLVVTFALFAHRQHALSDRAIGGLFASMTVPFALLTYPAARLLRQRSAPHVLLGASFVYALSLLAIPRASTAQLLPTMLLSGVASAAIFAAQLATVVKRAPDGADGRGMALFNAAGCAGMLLGPIVAGLTSALVRGSHGALGAYHTVFSLAAGSVLLWCGVSAVFLLGGARRPQTESIRVEGG